METYQLKSTPIAPKVLLNNVPDGSDLDEDTKARFGTVIGSLIYLIVGTRLDIAFALRTLSRFTSPYIPAAVVLSDCTTETATLYQGHVILSYHIL